VLAQGIGPSQKEPDKSALHNDVGPRPQHSRLLTMLYIVF